MLVASLRSFRAGKHLMLQQFWNAQCLNCNICAEYQHAQQLLCSIDQSFIANSLRKLCATSAFALTDAPKRRRKVAVAVSGGVDSAVAACLMKRQGHEVFGIFMRNWDEAEEKGGQNCSAEADYQDAERVCRHIGIPLHEVDFISEYWNQVFVPFLDMMKRGLTPNPDLQCNRHIKFQALLSHARTLGAEIVATGHYARLIHSQDEPPKLLRAIDTDKDQTYFLSSVPGKAFKNIIFPLGNLLKSEVRSIAEAIGLHVASRRSSTGICFIGRRNFQEFLEEYSEAVPGVFIDVDEGEEIGKCPNILAITLGQKAGLGGQKERLYVVGKDIPGKKVFVASGASHPALLTHTALLGSPHWISGSAPDALTIEKDSQQSFRCQYIARYRQPLQSCALRLSSGYGDLTPSRLVKLAHEDQPRETDRTLLVKMQEAARSITPQQSFVLYTGDVCLGSAPIICPGQTLWETENNRKKMTYAGQRT